MNPLRQLWDLFRLSKGNPVKFNPDHYHYKDCELYGQGPLGDSGCWCEHRGPRNHYSGCVSSGWHRESCSMVGVAWVAGNPNKPVKRERCECQESGTGQYILTLQNGTVHGPAPAPMLGKILDGDDS